MENTGDGKMLRQTSETELGGGRRRVRAKGWRKGNFSSLSNGGGEFSIFYTVQTRQAHVFSPTSHQHILVLWTGFSSSQLSVVKLLNEKTRRVKLCAKADEKEKRKRKCFSSFFKSQFRREALRHSKPLFGIWAMTLDVAARFDIFILRYSPDWEGLRGNKKMKSN